MIWICLRRYGTLTIVELQVRQICHLKLSGFPDAESIVRVHDHLRSYGHIFSRQPIPNLQNRLNGLVVISITSPQVIHWASQPRIWLHFGVRCSLKFEKTEPRNHPVIPTVALVQIGAMPVLENKSLEPVGISQPFSHVVYSFLFILDSPPNS